MQKKASFGISLARGYYETYGKGMIGGQFPELASRIAVGLVGEGSECFGFDDSYSTDHDFGPGFCMWLNRNDWEKYGVQLEQAYENLPGEYGGMAVRRDTRLSGKRTGVWCIDDFYGRFLGCAGVPKDWQRWLYLPEHYFSLVMNGEVFRDDLGEFTAIREELKRGYPEDVRIKKIAARAAVMAQAGQYNYGRCLRRGEYVAAELALAEFMKAAMSMVYLLNHGYAPFYKWMHRGLRNLGRLSETSELFEQLVCPEVDRSQKAELIENICRLVVGEWKRQGLTDLDDAFLQVHLDGLMSRIGNEEIRRLHWLEG